MDITDEQEDIVNTIRSVFYELFGIEFDLEDSEKVGGSELVDFEDLTDLAEEINNEFDLYGVCDLEGADFRDMSLNEIAIKIDQQIQR